MVKREKEMALFKRHITAAISKATNNSSQPKSNTIPNDSEKTEGFLKVQEKPVKNIKGAVNFIQNIKSLCKEGRLKNAVGVLKDMDKQGVRAEVCIYASLLQFCLENKALAEGKIVHNHMIEKVFNIDLFLSTKLVVMYAKCKSLRDARKVFDGMPKRNSVSWNAMIGAYAKHGKPEEALKLFYNMKENGVELDKITFISVLPACAKVGLLVQTKKVHEEIRRRGYEDYVVVGNGLVDAYVKCGSLEDACEVFDEMPQRDVVSWNVMIAACVKHGKPEEALKLFYDMKENGFEPNHFSFANVLPACAKLGSLDQTKRVHEEIRSRGFEDDVLVGTGLVDTYAKCGSLESARQVFQEMPQRNAVSWNAMLGGYAQNGIVDQAFKVFHEMPQRNAFSWNTMIAAYAKHGKPEEALRLFYDMKEHGVELDRFSFGSVLHACAKLGSLDQTKRVHEEIRRSGFEDNVFVGSGLVDTYVKCGSLEDARKVFDSMPEKNVVSCLLL